jgi:hypothetical protein
MGRDIRDFDNEKDLRAAWKVFDKASVGVRYVWCLVCCRAVPLASAPLHPECTSGGESSSLNAVKSGYGSISLGLGAL